MQLNVGVVGTVGHLVMQHLVALSIVLAAHLLRAQQGSLFVPSLYTALY
jgi:hypothetical protein